MKFLTKRTFGRQMLAVAAMASLSFGALAQEAARQVAPGIGMPIGKTLTLPCCNCLGGTTQLNLSTGAAPWTVAGGAGVALVSNPPTAWSNLPALGNFPASKWVGPNTNSGSTGATGTTTYQVTFMRPKCLIPAQSITISGKFLADNKATITASGPGVSAGTFSTAPAATVYGFLAANAVPFSFTATGPGLVTLSVRVYNESGPTGLLVSAAVTKQCIKDEGSMAVEMPLDKKE